VQSERRSRIAPKLDTDLPFNPMDEGFLRSREGREIPPSPGRHLASARYPDAADLDGLLNETHSGARLRWACPIVATPDGARKVLYARTLTLPDRRRDAHVVAWGPTGVGKSTCATLPLLLSDLQEPGRCVVSVSLKGEEYPLLAACCAAAGIELGYLDLSDPRRSVAFNPLAAVDESAAYDVIASFVNLVVNYQARDSEFWRQSGTTFMAGAWHAGCHSFAAILDLFEAPREEALERLDGCGHPSARATAAFLGGGSQNADTTVATVVGWLNPFRDPAVRVTTSSHELDRAALFRRPRVLAVRCPEPRLPALRPVYNLLLQWLLDAAVATADEDADDPNHPPVSLYIEDLPAWGAIRSLVDRLATLRSRRISVTAAVQSMAQLRYAYGGDAEAVEKAFVNKIVLPGVDQADAEYFARCSGEQQVVLSRDGGDVLHEVVVGRTVLSSSDIRSPPWRHFLLGQPATFVLQDMVFQAYLCPIYLNPDATALLPPPGAATVRPPERSRPLTASSTPTAAVAAGTPSFTDARDLEDRIASAREGCGWPDTTGCARDWWRAFEHQHAHRRGLVLRLLEELQQRGATITEFIQARADSDTDDVQRILHHLDRMRLEEEWKHKKEADAQASHLACQSAGGGLRLRTGDRRPPGAAGRHLFDGYVDGVAGPAQPPNRRLITVHAGDRLLASALTTLASWWKRVAGK
jgi:hypothetical protein